MGLSRLDLDTRIGPNQSLVNRLIGDNDTIVRELQTNDRFRTLAAGQYVDGSYILLKRSTKNGPSEVYIYDQNGNSRTYANDVLDWSPRLATIITRQQELVCITPQGLLITDRNGRLLRTVRAPAPLHYGILRNHPDGTLSALAIDARGSLHASNMHKWIAVGMTLAVHGDRAGVLAAYPGQCGHLYGAVYKYVNEYNKGLCLIDVDFTTETTRVGVLSRSAGMNIGFDPDVHLDGATLIVSAKNSTKGEDIHFSVPIYRLDDLRPEVLVSEAATLQREKSASFMIGGGVSLLQWKTESEIVKDDITYMKVRYDLSDSTFYRTRIEGRLGDADLVFAYMQNLVEDELADSAAERMDAGTPGEVLARKASRQIFSTLNLPGMLIPSASLRLLFEISEVNGVASYTDRQGYLSEQLFSSRYNRIAALMMLERGHYIGLDYVNYQMPSAIGIESTYGDVLTYYDESLKINKIGAILGYDSLSYARRYETNFSRWYADLSGGIGIGNLSVSDEIIHDAESRLNASIGSPLFVAYDVSLDAGYLVQRRSRRLRGAGIQFSAGYRAKWVGMDAIGQSDNQGSEKTKLIWSKFDLLHGPFVEFSIIF